MRKLVVPLLVAALAATAGAWCWGARRAERAHGAWQAWLGQALAPLAVEGSYRRGWLRAEATTRLRLPPQTDAPGEAVVLEIRDHIAPGPIAWGDWRAGPVLAVVHSEAIAQLPEGGLPLLRAETVIDAAGRATTRFVSLPWDAAVPTPALAWEDVRGTLRFEAPSRRLAGELVASLLHVGGPEAGVSAHGVQAHFEYRESRHGLPLGELRLRMATLAVEASEDTRAFRVDGLELEQSQTLHDGSVDSLASLSYRALVRGEVAHAGGSLELALRQLDAASLARLVEGARASESASDDAGALTARLEILAAIPKLLANAEFELRGAFATVEGPVEFEGSVQLDEGDALSMLSPTALVADARARVPVVLLEQEFAEGLRETDPTSVDSRAEARRRLASLVERGLLVLEEGNYATHVRYDAGRLEVNGQPVRPGDLDTLRSDARQAFLARPPG